MSRHDDDSQQESGPSFLERTIARFAPQYALNRAIAQEKLTFFGYDAAHPGKKRGYSGGAGKNAASESGRMNRDRIALMWDARDMERQMPVAACALDRYVQYVFSELNYSPATGDPEVNLAYRLFFEDWMENHADLTEVHDFGTLAKLYLRSYKRDGDAGAIVITDPDIAEMPTLQAIESDRIGNPMTSGLASFKDNYAHGIKLDQFGRPQAYEVFNRTKEGSYTFEQDVEAYRFLHVFKAFRLDQYRGVTWFSPVLPQFRDLYEAFEFERGAAKWAASIAGVIRYNGARTPGGDANGPMGWGGYSRDKNNNELVRVQANRLARLRPGEDVTPFQAPNRPSGSFQALIELSLRDIAQGLNIPYGFFDMSRFNGVTSRIEIQQCQRTFAAEQRLMTRRFLNPIRDVVLAWGIANQKIPAHPKWRSGTWNFGAEITADVGYQTQADINMMLSGLKTGTSITAAAGTPFEEVIDKLTEEAAYIYRKAVEAGVPVEMIVPSRFTNATDQLSAMNAAGEPEIPPPPTIETIGDSGAAKLADIQAQVARGEIPREQAVAMLVSVWNMDPAVAEAITPRAGIAAPPKATKSIAPKFATKKQQPQEPTSKE